MDKFKIGDRVRIDPNSRYGEQAEGEIGTVRSNSFNSGGENFLWISVRWDKQDYSYNYPIADLSLAETDWDE